MSSEFWKGLGKGLVTSGRWSQVEQSLNQDWYTVNEAIKELSNKGFEIHKETLRRWIRDGKVEVSQPSPRKTIIHKNELVRLLMRSQP